MSRQVALAVSIFAAFVLAWLAEQTPRPAGADTPAVSFSATRAFIDDQVIAQTPHPTGSPANGAVRDYLLRRMSALGLQPQVQSAQALTQNAPDYLAGARVENLIGVLPGANRGVPAVAIMAHYDSVPGSPGAADDAASVAAGLEAVRALKAGGQLPRDVMLVLTDGEEPGLLGARAFFALHPLAKHIGFVLNMEARGGGGRVQMFQTGTGGGGSVELFRKTARSPAANSLAAFIYGRMPNDTDFSIARRAGLPGLNYAFIGRQFDYHAASSTPANLDRGSLQHMGDQVLATAKGAALSQSLPRATPDLTYAQTVGSQVIAYGPATGWSLLALAAGLIALGGWLARRRGDLAFADVAKGASAAAYLLTLGAALLRLARGATGVGVGFLEQRPLLAQAGLWEVTLALIGVAVLFYAPAATGHGRARFASALLAAAAGLGCTLIHNPDWIGLALGVSAAVLGLCAFGRPARVSGAWTGLLLMALAVAVVLQAAAPTTAFLVAWPLVVAALAAALSAGGSWRSPILLVPLAILASASSAWLLGQGHGIFQALDTVEALAAIGWLCALGLWPLLQPPEDERRQSLAAFALLLAACVLVAWIRFVPPWSARHPQITNVGYVVDRDAGTSRRVVLTDDVSPWSESVLLADGGTPALVSLPILRQAPVRAAPALAVPAEGPKVTLAWQADGSLSLRAAPPAGARIVALDIRTTSPLAHLKINGIARDLDPSGRWIRLRWIGDPNGISLSYFGGQHGEIETRFASVSESWPAGATPLPRRPVNEMAMDLSDSTYVTGARRFRW
jgi:hypothetical protein